MKIFIRDLEVSADIGIHPHEQGVSQPLIFNLWVEVVSAPISSISDTICYESLSAIIIAATHAKHIDLVEQLAETILAKILADKRIRTATLHIAKPNAIETAAAAGVEITQSQ